MKLNIAVCDDDNTTLNQEREILKSVLDEQRREYIIDTFSSPEEMLKKIEKYNIIVLDVEMDGMNGIEAAEMIRGRNKHCLVFFVTNYSTYLDDALNNRAFRFWTKPIDRRKLIYGINSAVRELENAEQKIEVTLDGDKISLFVRNIIYIYAQERKLHIITTGGEIITNDTFETIMAQLKNSECIYEPHRSYLVNLEYVRSYNKDKILCSNGDKIYEVYLSRRKYDSFNKRFVEWLGGR